MVNGAACAEQTPSANAIAETKSFMEIPLLRWRSSQETGKMRHLNPKVFP
jgi:hypothetical protein